MSPIIIVGIILTVFILLILIISAMYREVVPTNMVHIVNTSKGRRVYGKDSKFGNTYYNFPAWLPKIGVSVTQFPISNFGVELAKYAAYDHKRLPFSVDVQAFFVMEDADIVSQRVSDFPELKAHLRQIVSGAVRKVCAGRALEDILSSRSELANDFDKEVVEQLKAWGVRPVNSIEFMNIQDTEGSKVIHDIQKKEESRIDRESRMAQADNTQAAETKEIETKRQIELQRQEAEQQIGQRKAVKEQAVGISREQSLQAIAEQAKLTTQKNIDNKKVQDTGLAAIQKEVTLINAEQDREQLRIQAEAAKAAQVIAAEAERKSMEERAEGQRKAAELQAYAEQVTAEKGAIGNLALAAADAQGISAIGKAKAEAEQQMQMASVTAQTELALKIGENTGYQQYLLNNKQIEVNGDVGIAQAKALEKADIKIVGGKGSETGLSIGSLLTGLITTDAGKALVERVAGQPLN